MVSNAASRWRRNRSVSNSAHPVRAAASRARTPASRAPSRASRQRKRLVVGQGRRHELGQPGRAQQAPRDAAGERGAEAGHHRHAGPQRVARRRVRVARQRVEEEVGEPVPRKMRPRRGAARRRAAPGPRRAPRPRGAGSAARRGCLRAATARCPRPDAAGASTTSNTRRRDLVGVVERAEHEPVGGKPLVGARRRLRSAIARVRSLGW